MQVTDEHEDRARALVTEHRVDWDDWELCPAQRGYLAAVERVTHVARCRWESSEGALEATPDGTVLDHRDMGEFSPDEAREFAFELLVLADLAEAATPEGGEDRG